MVVPENGWFIMGNPIIKWMIWGYPDFRKPPYPHYSLIEAPYPTRRWSLPVLRSALCATKMRHVPPGQRSNEGGAGL